MTDLTDIQEKIVDFRSRILRGEEVPPEELAEALKTLRIAREAALIKPKAKKRTVKEDSEDATSEED